MERFCDKCGSLVSGNGKFCPLCGAKMGFELNISSDLDIDTGSSFLDNLDTGISDGGNDVLGADSVKKTDTVHSTVMNTPNTANTDISTKGNVPQYLPPRTYGQPNGASAQDDTEKLTMGQWVGTLLLSTCLGIVSIILLILWGFGATAKEPRKSFAKAMLVLVPIVYIISFFGMALLYYLMHL